MDCDMIYSVEKNRIIDLLKKQIDNLFFLEKVESDIIDKYFDEVLLRVKKCFAKNKNKYYSKNGVPYFDPYMSVQYMIFLYYFANTIYEGNKESSSHTQLCSKLYYLNKTLNGVDVFYAVKLPDFFMAEHPVGSVMGRATYNDGFMFYQGCTVGGFHVRGGGIVYPTLGENVRMFANTSIIGNSKIGNNVDIGAGALIKNQDVPDNCIVFGSSPNLIIKEKVISE